MPKPPPPTLPPPEADASRALQQRLLDLGYLLPGDVDGQFGPATQNAVLAFQKWERLDRTGLVDARTRAGSRSPAARRRSPAAARASGPRS